MVPKRSLATALCALLTKNAKFELVFANSNLAEGSRRRYHGWIHAVYCYGTHVTALESRMKVYGLIFDTLEVAN